MTALDERYPGYGFAAHKGYSTRAHMRALAAHGPCPEHRMSFANVNGRPAQDGGQDPDAMDPLTEGADLGAEQPLMKENGPMVDLIAGPRAPVQVRQEGRA
jgi:ribonuclease HII